VFRVTSLAVGIYGYDDGKTCRLVAHSLVLHMATDRGHTECQEGLYQQHAQPVAHGREGLGRELLLRCVSAIKDHTAITDKAMW